MRLKQLALFLVLALATAPHLFYAADNQAIATALNKFYKGYIMELQTFYDGSTLEYSSTGSFIKGGKPGPWTLDSSILVKDIKLNHKWLVIRGNRLDYIYVKTKKKLVPYRASDVVVKIAAAPPL